MSKTVHFYYDYVSPYSYFAWSALDRIKGTGAEVVHHPIFLGGLNAELGITAPAFRPGVDRIGYLMADLKRLAADYQVPMAMNSNFPMNTLNLLRGAPLAIEAGVIEAYSTMGFQACWEKGLNPADRALCRTLVEEVGLDGAAWEAYVTDPANKASLKARTSEAIQAGVFGAPFFIVGEERFWGQDRLHHLMRLLEG